MEKEFGLNAIELDNIFAQIKAGKEDLAETIYNEYLPMIEQYSSTYRVKKEQVQDIYNEVFCYVYDKIMKGVIKASDFNESFEKIMTNQCIKAKQNANTFNSELLSMSYAKNVASREAEAAKKAEESDYATQSLLFVIEVMNELIDNPELAQENGLTETKIDMIKDFYGLNKQHKRYNNAQIAEKYNVTESRAKAMLVSGLKSLRQMKDFQPIKKHLHS
ncbi:MAG: sigma-70 family RNA polymerase sigma factor [Clostridia bacterium]|nr:sigma-70 family RNA polymerase sigma factor [Clostridia bacterium]